MRLGNSLSMLARLVSTEVNYRHILFRSERTQLVNEVSKKNLGLFTSQIRDAGSLSEGERVPRHIKLGDHCNTTLLRITKNVLEFRLRVILANLTRKRRILLQRRTNLGLKPPSVIVRQMPMKNIHLVFGKMINQIEN